MTPVLTMLSGYWGLSEALAKALWQALGRARWSVAQEWRGGQRLNFDRLAAKAFGAWVVAFGGPCEEVLGGNLVGCHRDALKLERGLWRKFPDALEGGAGERTTLGACLFRPRGTGTRNRLRDDATGMQRRVSCSGQGSSWFPLHMCGVKPTVSEELQFNQ